MIHFQGEAMSTSIVRDVCLFTAGMACASAIAVAGVNFSDKEPVTPQQFEQRARELLVAVTDLGSRVGNIDAGRVGIYSNPPIACTTPPRPTEPSGGIDPQVLTAAIAMATIQDAARNGIKEPVRILEKCRPAR